MNPNFEIKNKTLIYDVLDKAEYGTLALCIENKPYAVPLNFVGVDDDIYFHGALKNKKMKMLEQNPYVSFSVVENYALIDSDFSSTEGLACPATQFYKSVSIDGVAVLEKSRERKTEVFEIFMQKHQPKGGYKSFNHSDYDKALRATALVKIEVENLTCKFKFGQHLNEERFNMIVSALLERGTQTDIETVKIMKAQRGAKYGV